MSQLRMLRSSKSEKLFQILCSNFIVELMPIVANHLLNTPLSAALFDYYFLNYGLVEPIQYLNDSILLKHRGNTFGILRKGNENIFQNFS